MFQGMFTHARPARRPSRCGPATPPGSLTPTAGLTVIELLVTLTIIVGLICMLLPAVQSAREASRRVQCRNNLRQIALGCIAFEGHYGHFPSGGWGWRWVGDPDRGSGTGQPGGWAYSILPFTDGNVLHQMAADGRPDVITSSQRRGAAIALATPPSGLTCPSRRPALLFPQRRTMFNSDDPPSMLTGRTDFAINAGDGAPEGPLGRGRGEGPPVGAMGFIDRYPWWWKDNKGQPPDQLFSGLSFVCSRIRPRHVVDGLSKTYLAGEKYLDPQAAFTGTDLGDNENYLAGFNNDTSRSTLHPPRQDRAGTAFSDRFGSSHPESLSMAFADGSVRGVAYSISPAIHRAAGHRADGR